MATNNSINLKSSGIASYDGAGTFSALANPLTVTNGGTGAASETAYAVLCGGTTSTAAIQPIASVGSSTNLLTSSGSGALPTFKALASSYQLSLTTGTSSNTSYAGGFDYFLALGSQLQGSNSTGFTRVKIPITGTITKTYCQVSIQGVTSAESVTFNVRVNTTDSLISNSVSFASSDFSFSNTSMTAAVTAGDFLSIKLTTPSWASGNVTGVRISVTCLIT